MHAVELHRYKSALTAKAAELSQELRSRRLIAVEKTSEACENMVLATQRELVVAALDRHSRQLREIKAALARIEHGIYGICELCEQPIRPKRLEAVPWTRYCIACQQAMDHGSTWQSPMAA